MYNTRNRFIIGCVCVAILVAGLVTYLIVTDRGESEIQIEDFASENLVQEENIVTNETEDSESASTEMGKTVEESEKEMEENEVETEASLIDNNTNTNDNTTKKESEATSTNLVTNTEADAEKKKEDEEKEEKNVEPEFCAPVKGEIIREFASESLVYSNTLQEWVTHNGIDIKADKTSVVSSAANGTVYAIKNDPRYGLTVIVNHDGGFQTIYSNLLTAEFVVEGEEVEAGQTIGTVGNSASFEISDEYHLHFEILKNNKYIDPTTCISF